MLPSGKSFNHNVSSSWLLTLANILLFLSTGFERACGSKERGMGIFSLLSMVYIQDLALEYAPDRQGAARMIRKWLLLLLDFYFQSTGKRIPSLL